MDMKLFSMLIGVASKATGGGGAVKSVNGKTGEVNLTASDVNAAPATRALPTGGSTGDALVKKSNSNYDVEWVNLLNKFYPVGSIYQSVNSTSPATLFGGSWEQIKDVFLLASGDTYSAGATGGEATHTIVKGELPNETYRVKLHYNNDEQETKWNAPLLNSGNSLVQSIAGNLSTLSTDYYYVGPLGDGTPMNNMPPYEVVYCWKRTA